MDSVNANLPEEAKYIIRTLNENHFEAFLVGGCVRDILMGMEPKDWDITTDALPEQVKALFDKTVDTGLKHGTVTVIIGEQSIEVTTFRIEGKYSNHRRPDKVIFTSYLEQDLGRRDFTINSIAYHPEKGFIDPFNGIEDIEKGVIRAVGDADRRFEEDSLRMLRAVRFAAQLDFKIDPGVMESIKNKKTLISKISKERIRDELTKILVSPNPSKFIFLKDLSILAVVLPELNKYSFDKIQHIIGGVEIIKNDPILRWTMLLREESKDSANYILRNLKFDNNTIKKVCRLIEFHHINIDPVPKCVRRAVSIVGEDIFLDLTKIIEAVLKAEINNCNGRLKSFADNEYYGEEIKKVNTVRHIYYNAKEKGECMNIKDLAVSGSDLINIGFKEGEQIGKILSRLLEAVIENPEMNKKEELLKFVAKFLQK
ncbi:MAG: CCA tRNA nucleotidyltransferase [Firmicutes bacterium]|nr:CCA tRNA nucleotidyltransferase [Bacillota bacterium]